jgi:hypothetical protein
MKILLVHPDDSVEAGPWAGMRWDWAVDLGWSGRAAYARQIERLGFRVSNISDVLDHGQHRRQMRDLLAVGSGHLLDSEAIDWWNTFSVHPYRQLEQLLLVSTLAEQIPQHSELVATRPHFSVNALALVFNPELSTARMQTFLAEPQIEEGDSGFRERFRRYRRSAFALRPSQLAEIAFDKWDADYRLRRHFGRPPKTSSNPAILLPTSYGNVTRAQVAYARMLPHRRFLLVATRRSGRIPTLPENVELRWLASYAPKSLQSADEERRRLLAQWRKMQGDLFEKKPVFRLANKLHVFDGFADFLKNGLRVRDAWREVFSRETITAVLSADEYNPYTRLPALLASSRKLPTIFCDHGALNMSFGIFPAVSDSYLLQGEMARDYSVGCGLPADRIIVGAPALGKNSLQPVQPGDRDWIVFYSEQFELASSRTQTLYGELLPELCALAARTNRKVVIKLHPFESRRMRKKLVERVLSTEQRRLVEMREGPMTPDLFARAWCSITVESSVAVESTMNRVPCFLCSWFDASWYGYGKQYAKFSAAYSLDSPQRIREIPQLLEQLKITEAIRHSLQTPISPDLLESVLSGN